MEQVAPSDYILRAGIFPSKRVSPLKGLHHPKNWKEIIYKAIEWQLVDGLVNQLTIEDEFIS
jgi:hypothetical protein